MNGLPKQRISFSAKNKSWGKQCIDHYEKMSYTDGYGNRTSNYRKAINYDLFNGRFDKKDLDYVCNPLGLKESEFPATLQHYDIISPALMLLIGEESKRPDNFKVVAENPEAVSSKEEKMQQMILESLKSQLMAAIDPSTVDPNNPPKDPAVIQHYIKHSYSDVKEIMANQSLNYLKRNLNTRLIFNKGWKDVLIAGEEIYWVGISNGEPSIRRCNPMDVSVVLDADSDFIDDASAVVEVRKMSISSILDEFGDLLTAAEVNKLEDLARGKDTSGSGSPGAFAGASTQVYTGPADSLVIKPLNGVGPAPSNENRNIHSSSSVRVVRVEWKSMRKIGIKSFLDEQGLPQEQMVDEAYSPADNETVEWFWINEAWEGIKIGSDIYVGVQPKPNQRRRLDNPYYCRLGYTGLIYNATNSVSVSLIDRMKAYQYLYNILMYRLELAFASDMGKVFLMDIAQIPQSEGWDVEKWMYYLKAMKIAFVNSHEEGKRGSRTGMVSQFNQFQAVDLSLGNQIQSYVQSLEFIRTQMSYLSGVTPQRLGSISNQELVGNVERSVVQSSHITEYWFDSHNEVKKKAYTALLECAKVAWRKGKKVQYVLDDMTTEFLNIDGAEFENAEYGVFMSNSSKDEQVIQTLKQLTETALQSDKATLSGIARMLSSDSISDITRMLEAGEDRKFERDQATAQAQQESQERINAQMMDMKMKELELKKYEIDTKAETEITKAQITSYIGQESLDQDNDGTPDPVEIAKLALEERKAQSDAIANQLGLANERVKLANDREKLTIEREKIRSNEKIKEKEIAVKKIAARKKPSSSK